jgi:hypothetical protein
LAANITQITVSGSSKISQDWTSYLFSLRTPPCRNADADWLETSQNWTNRRIRWQNPVGRKMQVTNIIDVTDYPGTISGPTACSLRRKGQYHCRVGDMGKIDKIFRKKLSLTIATGIFVVTLTKC